MASAVLLFALSVPALAARAPSAPGELVITEFMSKPTDLADYNAEWFELKNTTDDDLELGGLLVRGAEGEPGFQVDASLMVDGDTVLGPGEFVVFGVNENTDLNGGVEIDGVYPFDDLELIHTGDTLRLLSGTTTIDTVEWGASVGWTIISANASMQVNLNAIDSEWANDLPQNWCQSDNLIGAIYATPGANNEFCGSGSDDDDGDGYTIAEGDCNDDDPDVHPDTIDGVGDPYGEEGDDRNCDGVRDDGEIDDDLDGYTEVQGDCDDTDPDLSPGVFEANDGIDNDCNGCIDDFDDDGDEWSECWTGAVEDCNPDDGVDCSVFAVAGEVGSETDPPRFVFDDTTHGLFVEGACALAFDHNDEEPDGEPPSRYPCAPETAYDGIDQSGDGYDACDLDGDGFPSEDCTGAPSPGFTQTDADGEPVEADCDDRNASVFPGGDEGDPEAGGIPDNEDNDCNGIVDDPYLDLDGDGVTVLEGDCRDALPADDSKAAQVFPGATEVCGDGIDNDCNGLVDDACSNSTALGGLGGGGLCGVTGGRGAGGLAGLLLLGGLLARRRSSERPDAVAHEERR
jgi:hypothetical protein